MPYWEYEVKVMGRDDQRFLSAKDAYRYYHRLLEHDDVAQETIRIFGKAKNGRWESLEGWNSEGSRERIDFSQNACEGVGRR